jgi:hypothetical protein
MSRTGRLEEKIFLRNRSPVERGTERHERYATPGVLAPSIRKFSKLTDMGMVLSYHSCLFCPHVSVAMTTGDSRMEAADSPSFASLATSLGLIATMAPVNSPAGIALPDRLIEASVFQRHDLAYETLDCFRSC